MTDFNKLPVKQDLPDLPRGDSRTYTFFAKDVCWTEEEPVGDLPEGVIWEQHFWWAEMRSNFPRASRYYNGWVPWYGNPPSTYVWWIKYSLGAVYTVTSEYDAERGGTLVHMHMPSDMSWRPRPGRYHWSVRSGVELTPADEETGQRAYYGDFVTWAVGKQRITTSWTLTTGRGGA